MGYVPSGQLSPAAPSEAEAQAKAAKLRETARGHKRAVASHRRLAKEAMQRLEEFERFCSELGITLVIEEAPLDAGPLGAGEVAGLAAEVRASLEHPTNHTAGRQSDDSSTQVSSA